MLYSQLNQSTTNLYNRWNEYRKMIDDIINGYIDGDTIIIGAGNGNDLIYSHILKGNVKIDILDIDKKAVQKGLDRDGIAVNDIFEIDITGIKANVSELIINSKSQIALIENFKTLSFEKIQLEKSYDTIIISPIISQLFLNQVMAEIQVKYRHINQDLLKVLMDKTGEIITNFIEFIKSISKEYSKIIFWNDILQFKSDYEFLKELTNESATQYLNEYFNKYGISPVKFGHDEIKKLGDVLEEEFLHWNFNDEKAFLVQLNVVEIK